MMENIDFSQLAGAGDTGLTVVLVLQLMKLLKKAKDFFAHEEVHRAESHSHREAAEAVWKETSAQNKKIAEGLERLAAAVRESGESHLISPRIEPVPTI